MDGPTTIIVPAGHAAYIYPVPEQPEADVQTKRFVCGNGNMLPLPTTCHCGARESWHADTDANGNPGGWTRHLCEHCDAVRCDAYPGACRRRPIVTEPQDNPEA